MLNFETKLCLKTEIEQSAKDKDYYFDNEKIRVH